jgi:predicted GIY-YIG superfamily endonuclease
MKLKQIAVNRHPKEGGCIIVPCKDCDSSYIGETGRNLKKRLVDHKAAVRKGDRKNGIAVHAWEKEHEVDWSNAHILKCENN